MILLVIGFLIELSLAILLSKGDFFRPSVIVSGIMFAAAVCALYLSYVWNFVLLDSTIVILLGSVLLIIIVDKATSVFVHRTILQSSIYTIELSDFLIVLITVFGIVVIIWHYRYLMQAVGNLGSLRLMIASYRNRLVWETLETSMPGFLSRGIRMLSNFAFIYLYVFINNCIAKRKIKGNLKLLIPVAMYGLDSMLMGARGYLMYIVFAAVVYAYVLYQRSVGWKVKEGFKYIRKVVVALVVVAVVFVALGNFVGRTATGSIFYRLSLYFGGGIALLNDYFDTGGATSPGFGAVTFTTFYSFMSRRFGWSDYSSYFQFEFRYHNGINWGNVYTALRRYHQDFGYVGVLVMVSIFALFFGIYYTRIRNKRIWKPIDFSLLYYGIMIRAQFLFFFDDEFFNDFVTPSIVVNIIELLICLFLVRMRINFSKGKISLGTIKPNLSNS